MSFLLIVGRSRIKIPERWIGRWSLLSDLRDEMGATSLEWTNTSREELEKWVELNEIMDRKEKRGYHLFPLSPLWSTIVYMNPSSSLYLMYCQIDGALPDETRRTLYGDLGRYIRGGGRPTYLTARNKNNKGLYYNFDLAYDPVYGVNVAQHRHSTTLLPFSEMDQEIQEKVISLPYNTLTGILQSAYYIYSSGDYKKSEEDSWWDEIPWHLVNWKDVVRFHNGPLDARTTHNMLADYYRDLAECKDREKKMRKLFSYRSTCCSNVPYLLADEEPPRRQLEDSIEYTGMDSTGARFILVLGDDGVLIPKIPHFHLFWDRYLSYLSRVGTFLFSSGELTRLDHLGLFHLIARTRQQHNFPVIGKRSTKDLREGLWELSVALICQSRRRRYIDSMEYESVCQRLYDFLGPRTVEVFSTFLLDTLDNGANDAYINGAERERVMLFATAAAKVMSEADTPSLSYPKVLHDG